MGAVPVALGFRAHKGQAVVVGVALEDGEPRLVHSGGRSPPPCKLGRYTVRRHCVRLTSKASWKTYECRGGLMDKEALLAQRQYFDMVHGVTVRAIGVLADEDLEFRPKKGMRTAKEILFHMYAVEKILAEAARRGELLEEGSKEYTPEDEIGAAAASKIRTVKEMQQVRTALSRRRRQGDRGNN